MDSVTKYPPHDYLPATGHAAFLPAYDLIARLMGFSSVYQRLVSQAGIAGGHRVLEIGCGTGNLTLRAKRSQPSADVTGCDPDPRILGVAQRKANGLTGIRFEQGYAERLPYADGEFDRVLSSMMLHHIKDEAKPEAAAEIFRVLRPGGRLHLVDISGDTTSGGLLPRLIRHNHHAAGNLGGAVPRLLRSAGFDCTELATKRQRIVGQLTFYQAVRPA
ncbi:class I SAM-dependent methyltransferase [Mycobacterium sp. Aquia_213]|uniref:class I SAM-dependent methyltransferase n=1 Tax=Mycobacterium sp. Aquia_213 TaxID=2991728 RepID=UPI00226E3510|nr:class I SAM-dependent methyltransferase [Mycobacterium sp. Aquia_213]WAC90744.1 class I SAM-dependent methyltransferase [Mycobacterium sp. Aquia_213]